MLASEEQVARSVEVVREREILVDGLDAELTCLARVCDGDRPAVDCDLAGVGLEDSGDELDQGRLAGPVVTSFGRSVKLASRNATTRPKCFWTFRASSRGCGGNGIVIGEMTSLSATA